MMEGHAKIWATIYIHLAKESQLNRRWAESVSCIIHTCRDSIDYVRLRMVKYGLPDLIKNVIRNSVEVSCFLA